MGTKKNDNTITLYGGSETFNKDKTTTRTYGDKTSTELTYTQPLTPEQQQDFQQNYLIPLQQQYGIDPTTGQYAGDVSALLGFNPDEYKKQEEAKEKAAAFKRKEAGWANALKVVTDIATAAHGGNVYQTNLGTVAKDEAAKEEAARMNISNMGAAIDKAKRGQEMAFAKARQDALQKYYEKNGIRVKQTTTKQENDITKEEGGGANTDSWKQQIDQSKGNKAWGSGYTGSRTAVTLSKADNNGKITGSLMFSVPTYIANGYANYARTSLQQALENGRLNEADIKKLIYAGVYNDAATDPLKKWNIDAILGYGRTWNIDAIDDLIQYLWVRSDEYDGKPFNFETYRDPNQPLKYKRKGASAAGQDNSGSDDGTPAGGA